MLQEINRFVVFSPQFTHDNHPPPPTRNSIELLSVAQARLKELMDDLDGVDLFIKKMDMEEENFVPTGFTEVEQETQDGEEDSENLRGHEVVSRFEFSLCLSEDDNKKDDMDSGPDDEEVPTRGYLKRQANLIVDAKSRSKRGNRRR